ncbi:CLUMA_CG007482, isoform A [Clunio marinus]|uniref:CLUMA_CG007482, isoform A n=1 Tax=Clunio marinus TaxID=568069 RepID=A0A1J1I175_9DIPT|nr:CLUMA_CG007482, isoform A [Clunio marinus]
MTNDTSASASNYTPANYRSADVFGGNYPIQTPAGIVHSTQSTISPPLPPRPNSMFQQPQLFSPYGNNFGYGSSFGNGFYGMGQGMGFNSYGGGFGSYRGGYGCNPLDPETRFIQMAEESSRGAFQSIEQVNTNDFFDSNAQQSSSGLPMVLFLAFIFSAPYFIMKIFGSLMNTATDQTKTPATWQNAVDATVLYNFNGENQSELKLRAGQLIKIAPKEIQQMNRLLSTNWLLATPDGKNVGLVPVNYIRRADVAQIPNGEVADVTMEPIVIKNDSPVETTDTKSETTNDESNC